MPWFKVDDLFGTHTKAVLAGNAACGLWIRAGSWCAAHLTDGLVPAAMISVLGGRPLDARKLVQVGLWHDHQHDCEECAQPPSGDFLFHAWARYQPTKAETEAERARKAEAGRKGGQSSGRARRAAAQRTNGEAEPKQVLRDRSQSVEPPTRPDPTPSAAAAAGDERGGSGVALPEDLEILRSRMSEYSALAAIRWDRLTTDQVTEIQQLIARHGDRVLVDCALRTCRNTPPVLVNAFIGTWAALGAPRAVAPTEPTCGVCSRPRRACERAAQTVDPDDRHPFQESA